MELIEKLEDRSKQDADFFFQRIAFENMPVVIAGYRSLIDLPQTILLLQSYSQLAGSGAKSLGEYLDGIGEPVDPDDEHKITLSILQGRLLLLTEDASACFFVSPVANQLSRAIEGPTTENTMRGGLSSFVEDLDTNIGLLKKNVNSDLLRKQGYMMGSDDFRRLELFSIDKKANRKLLKAVEDRLNANKGSGLHTLQDLTEILGFPKWTLITHFNTTELPEEAAHSLRRGKIVLLMDRYPFAIIIPSLISDMFALSNDRNISAPLGMLSRLLRVIGVLANIIMPGLYVALVSVNPDVLRLELALTIAESRVDVPYPAIVETFFMLVILEMILEASIRLPKSVGPTITMVGGIVLGQAIVAAKLVSNLLIIILAATTIASSTVVGFQNSISIRVFKYLILVLSAVYGVVGLLAGMVILCGYLASLKSFNVPYLYSMKSKEDSNG